MWWIVAAVVLGGTAISLQAPINAALARELGGPVPEAAVSFGVGFIVLVTIALLQGQGEAFLKLPLDRLRQDREEFKVALDRIGTLS